MKRDRFWLLLPVAAVGVAAYLIATHGERPGGETGNTTSGPPRQAPTPVVSSEQERAVLDATGPNSTEGGSISGTVTNQDGEPLAGAQIIVQAGTDPRSFSDLFGGGFGKDMGDEPTQPDEVTGDLEDFEPFDGRCGGGFLEPTTTGGSEEEVFPGFVDKSVPATYTYDRAETNADGAFTTALLKPGTYSLVACGPYHYPSSIVIVQVETGTDTSGAHFTVREGAAIFGRIVDPDGNPIQGAKVSAGTLGAAARDCVAHDDGTFLIRGLEPRRYYLDVSAEGFLSVEVKESAPASDVGIVMRPAGMLRGRVIDRLTGKPINEFQVNNENSYAGPQPGADGRFTLTGLAAGNYDITVAAEGYAPRTVRDIRVEDGIETEQFLFDLVRGTTIVFFVTSALDRTPVSGARIGPPRGWFDDEDEDAKNATTTGEDGTCSFEHVAEGSYDFVVRHSDFADRAVTISVSEQDKRKEVDVALDKGLTLHGRVVTRGEQVPIGGAEVRLFEQGHFHATSITTTNGDGAFSFAAVAPGRHTIQAGHAGYAFAALEQSFDRAFNEELLIELGLGIHLVVEVSNPDGSSHQGAGIMIFGPDVAGEGDLTDENGRYVLEDCAPGRYHVRVGEAGKKGMGAFKEVDVPAGKETVMRFVLGGGARVYGAITLDGNPMEEMYVLAWPRTVTPERTDYTWGLNCSTDEHGRYSIPGLQPDDYVLEVWVDDYTDPIPGSGRCIVRRDFTLGTEDLQLDVELSGDSVTGIVLDQTGTPLQDAAVGIIPISRGGDRLDAIGAVRDADTGWHSTDGHGRFTIMGIGAGAHRLTVSRAGYANKIAAIEKEAGRDLSNVVIKLEKESSVLLRVQGGDHRVPDQLSVAVCDSEGRLLIEEDLKIAAETGECRINGLSPGRLTIVAATPNYAPLRKEVILESGNAPILDLQFLPGHELRVTLADDKGTPVPGAQVLLDPGGDIALAQSVACGALARPQVPDHTDDTGALTFKHVADGEYTVRVLAEGYEPGAADVRIAGSDEQVTVALKPLEDSTQ